MAGYMLNKELSSVSQKNNKNITKPHSKEGKNNNKCNFQHHHIINIVLIYFFPLLHGFGDFL